MNSIVELEIECASSSKGKSSINAAAETDKHIEKKLHRMQSLALTNVLNALLIRWGAKMEITG